MRFGEKQECLQRTARHNTPPEFLPDCSADRRRVPIPMNPVRRLMVLSVCLSATPVLAGDLAAPDLSIEQVIDRYVGARLIERQIQPAPPAADGTFVRRASVDLQG